MSVVLIGIGNGQRRDDGAGLEMVRLARDGLPDHVRVHECRGDATELMDRWAGARRVVVVDAASSGAPAGTIRRFDVARQGLPADLPQTSTHGFGLTQAVGLARAMGTMPAELVVYAIEGDDFSLGTGLSAPVRQAVTDCCRRVWEELAARGD